MTSPDDGPVRRVRFASTDVDEATELLRARYADHEPSFFGSRRDFTFAVASAAVSTAWGGLDVDRVRYSTGVTALVEPPRAVTVVVPLAAGRLGCTCGREQTTGGPMLCPPWTRFRSEWQDIDVAVGLLDPDGVRRVGAEISGLAPSAVAFTGMNPVSPAMGRYVAATVAHLGRDVVGNDEIMQSPLSRGQAFRELATALLVAFPNTTHGLDPACSGARAEPATVRRAVEFIDANAHRDIGLTEIAEAARLGVRGLQIAFRKHRDTTPLAYLKRVRLERAHRNLQAGDPYCGDTVARIAARWGFTHAGAFSVDYRRAYGRSPSETLRG